ncbi:MAG: YdiU family protein [Acidimicrobiales bacterium]|nr:YdiU family protein [Acidimicrobiales bacterium]
MTVTTAGRLISDLDDLPFDNRFTRDMPADVDDRNVRRQVDGAAFSRVAPTPVAAPKTIAWSAEVVDLLGMQPDLPRTEDFAQVFGGNRVPVGADPFAMAYGGHQFGSWAGQLGDGRAIALGEVIDRTGSHQMLQLKGAGPTPYSRTADGRAVLRSSVREFLCSEAMFHLGIPTTRALSLVTTGEQVVRDILYSGNPAPEPGAIVCRVAPSFTRFGTFQLPASRGDVELLERLVRVTVAHNFSHLDVPDRPLSDLLGAWLGEVAESTAALVVDWMRVGFVHGVLNTDNLSILGLTIDYGPYGWLEDWDPMWTPNTTDASGRRYRYGMQPQVAHWNLVQLANALVPLVGEDVAPLQEAVDRYPVAYEAAYRSMMARRLGWGDHRPGDDEPIEDLSRVLRSSEIDQVIFFRDLADVPVDPNLDVSDDGLLAPLTGAWYRPEEISGEVAAEICTWLRVWRRRVADGGLTDAERTTAMDSLNPRYVLRNYLAQEVIDQAESGDTSGITDILDVLRRPYEDQTGRDRFSARRPEWARHRVGCSMLSCSS